uniref:Uncharacterized protein n=1 Tax=viral metagenome TaxID=1070528 RepID=A0A6C0EC01_9ZZZZ
MADYSCTFCGKAFCQFVANAEAWCSIEPCNDGILIDDQSDRRDAEVPPREFMTQASHMSVAHQPLTFLEKEKRRVEGKMRHQQDKLLATERRRAKKKTQTRQVQRDMFSEKCFRKNRDAYIKTVRHSKRDM